MSSLNKTRFLLATTALVGFFHPAFGSEKETDLSELGGGSRASTSRASFQRSDSDSDEAQASNTHHQRLRKLLGNFELFKAWHAQPKETKKDDMMAQIGAATLFETDRKAALDIYVTQAAKGNVNALQFIVNKRVEFESVSDELFDFKLWTIWDFFPKAAKYLNEAKDNLGGRVAELAHAINEGVRGNHIGQDIHAQMDLVLGLVPFLEDDNLAAQESVLRSIQHIYGLPNFSQKKKMAMMKLPAMKRCQTLMKTWAQGSPTQSDLDSYVTQSVNFMANADMTPYLVMDEIWKMTVSTSNVIKATGVEGVRHSMTEYFLHNFRNTVKLARSGVSNFMMVTVGDDPCELVKNRRHTEALLGEINAMASYVSDTSKVKLLLFKIILESHLALKYADFVFPRESQTQFLELMEKLGAEPQTTQSNGHKHFSVILDHNLLDEDLLNKAIQKRFWGAKSLLELKIKNLRKWGAMDVGQKSNCLRREKQLLLSSLLQEDGESVFQELKNYFPRDWKQYTRMEAMGALLRDLIRDPELGEKEFKDACIDVYAYFVRDGLIDLNLAGLKITPENRMKVVVDLCKRLDKDLSHKKLYEIYMLGETNQAVLPQSNIEPFVEALRKEDPYYEALYWIHEYDNTIDPIHKLKHLSKAMAYLEETKIEVENLKLDVETRLNDLAVEVARMSKLSQESEYLEQITKPAIGLTVEPVVSGFVTSQNRSWAMPKEGFINSRELTRLNVIAQRDMEKKQKDGEFMITWTDGARQDYEDLDEQEGYLQDKVDTVVGYFKDGSFKNRADFEPLPHAETLGIKARELFPDEKVASMRIDGEHRMVVAIHYKNKMVRVLRSKNHYNRASASKF